MKPIQLSVEGNGISVFSPAVITAGTVGLQVEFQFDSAWTGLEKTAVFRANGKTLDCIGMDTKAVVPWELLKAPGCRLYAGVYGVNSEGTLQIPTVWADLGIIQPGADPAGDESADPALPIWQQLTREIEDALQEVLIYQNKVISGEAVPKPVEAGDGL